MENIWCWLLISYNVPVHSLSRIKFYERADREQGELAEKLSMQILPNLSPQRLVFLNANSEVPLPTKRLAVKLLRQAASGAKETVIDSADLIQAASTGLAKGNLRRQDFLQLWGGTQQHGRRNWKPGINCER
jgi:hypothetical protein